MDFVRRETSLLLTGDVLLLVFSLWLALTIRALHAPNSGFFLTNLVSFVPVFIISIAVFFIAGLYEKQTRLVRRVMGSRIIGAQVANTIIAAILFFLLPFAIAPKIVLLLYMLVSIACILMWRFYVTPLFSVRHPQLALLVGRGNAVHELFEEINGHNKYSIQFLEHIDTESLDAKAVTVCIQDGIANGARIIVIDTRDIDVNGELPALYGAMMQGVSFVDFATFYEDLFDRVPLSHIDYVWLLNALPRQHFLYDIGKRAFDIIGALAGLLFASIFIVPAVIILMVTGGSPLSLQNRIGRGGKVVRLIKLRSMLFNDHGDPVLREKNRVTAFGRLLRKTRIDELPQLYNVLVGELSFIGPRPEFPKLASFYEERIPYYGIRHVITPGLSGWAQIRDYDAPRHVEDVKRTERKLSYDLYYLKHRSFGLDMVITLKTIRALLAFSGV